MIQNVWWFATCLVFYTVSKCTMRISISSCVFTAFVLINNQIGTPFWPSSSQSVNYINNTENRYPDLIACAVHSIPKIKFSLLPSGNEFANIIRVKVSYCTVV